VIRRAALPLVLAAALGLALAGCSTPAPDPEACATTAPDAAAPSTDCEALTGSDDASSAPDDDDATGAGSGGADGDPVQADGLPDTGVVGCATLVTSSDTETDFDRQWSFEFECTDRSVYDTNVATLEAAGYTHSVSQDVSSGTLVRAKDHFITDLGTAFDVDLEIRGDEGEPLEMTLLFTLAKE